MTVEGTDWQQLVSGNANSNWKITSRLEMMARRRDTACQDSIAMEEIMNYGSKIFRMAQKGNRKVEIL